MPITNPTPPTLTQPVFADKGLLMIGEKLKTELSWLNNAYGRAERLPRLNSPHSLEQKPSGARSGRVEYEPLIWVGRNGSNKADYLSMLPDGHLKNYCFFYLMDGEEMTWFHAGMNDQFVKFALIFWWDYRTVFPTSEYHTVENVKREIFQALYKIKSPSFTINKTYTEARNIYKEFDHEEVRSQFLMRPYGGLRVEGEVKFKASCQ